MANTELTREEKILNPAQDSAFYRNEDGVYRIQYTCFEEDGYFNVQDENTWEEYRIDPADVKDTDSFFVVTEKKVGENV